MADDPPKKEVPAESLLPPAPSTTRGAFALKILYHANGMHSSAAPNRHNSAQPQRKLRKPPNHDYMPTKAIDGYISPRRASLSFSCY